MSGQNVIGLIGGIGLTEVDVYAQRPAPDGKYSGCPHVHAVTDEGYFVLRGAGAVEFHDLEHGFRRLDLTPGLYAHFPPLVMHRLISHGDLVILGIMGNAGLAERGEARVYFGPKADADSVRYDEHMALPKKLGLEGALQRRDAAVAGYQALLQLWETDRTGYFHELRRFFSTHTKAMSASADLFAQQVKAGPILWAEKTLSRISSLPTLSSTAPDVFVNAPGTESAFGMCGVLRPMLSLKSI